MTASNMAFFKKEDREEIYAKGGVIEKKGGAYTNEYADEAAELVRNISNGITEGFFFAVHKEGKNNAGIGRLKGMNKLEVLQIILRSLDMDFKDVVSVALMLELRDDED